MELNKVYHQDCLEGMKEISDKSIDMILCDLPYGTTACKWDVVIPFAPLWKQYERIIKDNGAIVLTASQPFTSLLITSNISIFKYSCIWEKSRPFGFMNCHNKPLKKHEDICIFSKGDIANGAKNKMVYNPQNLIEVNKEWKRPNRAKSEHNYDRPSNKLHRIIEFTNYPNTVIKISNPNNKSIHPTQKPVALFDYLIKTYTNEGETVLDNCMGSGTTAIACINTNRNYMGFEKEQKYYEIILNRIKRHTPQLKLIA